ncbi:hypothetical protein Amet_0793 [Alkaliphilus metalliredigens QYMF]|uniref:Flagellar hook-length control protein-like C-terminal domain-containing protein n=1 Tax=Alkaliphilus metalliredigens (strain QYMF) TaxID=293826 RepID=A6TLF0_ALKMQ|nr:DUF6240 domain-containing protein [Alkaliphilus metalliredigens]ABR47018.1 hypothetical protein Amet_0793 [Alkaliphilus metalliredigens QYMF]
MNPFHLGKSPNKFISNAYPRSMTPFKITGTLVQKQDQTVTIELGNRKLIELRLKNALEGRVGDQVSIERSQISNSRILHQDKQSSLGKTEGHQYGELLKEMKVAATEEALQAIKRLEQHGLPIKRDNVLGFMTTTNHLDQIVQGLDHQTALYLIEKEMDLEKDSLQQVAKAVKEGKQEKEGFSFFKLFDRGRNLSTEKAESIAKELYGSKMGKDVTDIIKALHQSGTEVKKKTINRVNEIFMKVNELKAGGSETLVDAVKNKVDASIDSLYKLKKAVVKNHIPSGEKVGGVATNTYGALSFKNGPVSEQALQVMEEEIGGILEANGLKNNGENIDLAKNLIKAQVPVTKENIEKIKDMQRDIREISGKLNYEKTAILLESGVDVEKESLEKLTEKLRQLEAQIERTPVERAALEAKAHEIMKDIQGLQKLEDKDLIQLLKLDADFNLEELSRLLDSKMGVGGKDLPEGVEKGMERIFSAHINVMKPLRDLQSLNFNTLAFQMKNQLPLSLEGLARSHRMLQGEEVTSLKEEQLQMPQEINKETMKQVESHVKENGNELGLHGKLMNMDGIQALIKNQLPLNQQNMLRLYEAQQQFQEIQGGLTSQMLMKGVHAGLQIEVMELQELASFIQENAVEALGAYSFMDGLKRVQVLDILHQIDIETLNFHHKNALPMTIEALEKSAQFLRGENNQQGFIDALKEIGVETLPTKEMLDGYEKMKTWEIERALNDPYVKEGQQYREILRAEQHLHRITQGLSKGTVEIMEKAGLPLEKMPLEEIVQHLEKNQQKEVSSEKGGLNQMLEKLQHAGVNREHIVSLLLKNAIPLNLKEVQSLSLLLKNQEQVGHQIGAMVKELAGNQQEEIKEIHHKMQDLLQEISSQVKSGKVQNERPYEKIAELIKELEGKQHLLDEQTKGRLQQTSDKLLESLEIQGRLNKEDMVLQLPFLMENQFKNLQIYVMNQKKGSKKIDPKNMSVLLNFDTNHMGNMNIYVAVNGKNVVMKMGVIQGEDQKLIEAYEKQLHGLFEALGYELKDLSYRVEKEQHILTMMDEVNQENGVQRNALDIRI